MSKTISNVTTAGYNLTAGSNPLTITATGGVEVSGTVAIVGGASQAWTVANAGTVSGSYGIELAKGGFVTNTGSIIVTYEAVQISGARGTVSNSGKIVGGFDGVVLFDGGTVTNLAGGTIAGNGNIGVYLSGAASTLTNAGTIIGSADAVAVVGAITSRIIVDPGAVFVGAVQGGSGSNTLELAKGAGSTGTIAGIGTQFTGFGTIDVDAGATWSLINTGTLTGVSSLVNHGSIATGVTLATGATLANAGSIGGGNGPLSVGVTGSQAAVVVTNTGSITSGVGISLLNGGVVANMSGASITGVAFGGVYIKGGSGTVTNDGGKIVGAGYAIQLRQGGTVSNLAAGVLLGTSLNTVYVKSGTIINAGTIINSGAHDAVDFSGTANRLIIDPGAVFTGAVQGNNGSDTLELAQGTAGGTGTITGLSTQYLGFGTIDVDLAAAWSLVNAGSIASGTTLVDSGMLSIAGVLSGNVDVTGAGTVSNAGTVTILGSLAVATIFNTGSLSAGQSVTGVSLLVNHGSITSTVALAQSGSVSNDGAIIAAAGIAAKSGGSIGNSGQIIGTDLNETGLELAGAGPTQIVTNSGTITGGVGVAMYGGTIGLLTNDAGGTIAATSQFGVLITETATLTNAGTIAGHGLYGAVYFQGSYADRLIADPGAVFVGYVQGSRGSTALELGAGTQGQAGTITGIGTQFRDFTSLAVDAGASWAFDASDTLGATLAVSNAGTMLFSEAAGGTITVATALTGAGTLVQAGSGALVLSAEIDNAVTLAGGTLELAGINTAPGYALHFAGAGTLRFDGAHTGTILGLAAGDTIDLATHAYVIGATATLASGNTLVVQSGADTTDLRLDPAQDFSAIGFAVQPDSGTGLQVSEGIACYASGTRLLTAAGEVAVEALRIGDLMVTASGAHRPVRWIGSRSYDGRFVAGNRDILPIRIHAGALADGVPVRDLDVSPRHALFLDGLLVPADALVNGHSIVQRTQVDAVSYFPICYFHVELDSHDILLAEGAAAESFVDDDSRMMFQNAASYAVRYPGADRRPARYCAPRVEHGAAVERLRARLAARARPAPVPGPLLGNLDEASHSLIRGWACDGSATDSIVRLRILDNGIAIAALDADLARPDLAEAGFGNGRHGFAFAVPGGLSPGIAHVIEVQRADDAAPLRGSPWVMSTLHLPAAVEPLRGVLDTAARHGLTGWACDGTEPVWLDVSVDDRPVATLVANRYRADLDQAGIGRGRAGFEVTFPGGLSPLARHIITVRRARDGAELAGSPVVIEPADRFDADLRQAVIGAVAGIHTREESQGILAFLQGQIAHLRQAEGALPLASPPAESPGTKIRRRRGPGRLTRPGQV